MSTFYGISGNNVSALFGSVGSQKNGLNSLFGTVSNSNSDTLSTYASIQNGSYFKLLKAYYSESGTSKSASSMLNTSTAVDSTKLLTSIESAADSLKNVSDELFTNGTDSVFKKTDKEVNGKVTSEYDTEKILKSVKNFASSYNGLLDVAGESETKSVLEKTNRMIDQTKTYEKLLNKVGVTIEKDNTLKIDEDLFKKSDMSTVKSIFNGANSLGYNTSVSASYIDYAATLQANKANTYNSYGNYSYNYTNGSSYDFWS